MTQQPSHLTKMPETRGAMVLCGGRSTRMGTPKHLLPFGSELMIQRIVRIVADVTDDIVVVAAAGEALPDFALNVRIVFDSVDYQGPLCGLTTGLAAFAPGQPVFLTGCDFPLLRASFISSLFAQMRPEDEVAAPVVFENGSDRTIPLPAIYRAGLRESAQELFDQGERRLSRLHDVCRVHRVEASRLGAVGVVGDSLSNANTWEEYLAALSRCGLNAPAGTAPNVLMEE